MASVSGQRGAARASEVLSRLRTPVQKFIQTESSSGIILISAAVIAFILANSPAADWYFGLLAQPTGIRMGDFSLEKPLVLWVNDLLMAIFFFLVGLEIKREVVVGELSSPRKAMLPIAGAIGGMVIPAMIYLAFTAGTAGAAGWGIPMATDIAFALGILALFGSRAPLGLKVFLLALAIVDDLGAVIVIALFYTSSVKMSMLLISFAVIAVAFVYGRFDGSRAVVYAVLGAVAWYFMLKSGVHATIAGVLLAFTVPSRHGMEARDFNARMEQLALRERDNFERMESKIHKLDEILESAKSPLHNMEHALAPWVAFGIMPVFAFFNAGVSLSSGEGTLFGSVTFGVALGLLVGKIVGVTGFAWLAVKAGFTDLPNGVGWPEITGAGLLAGIGFTMSLFIGGLAFEDPALLIQAKIGILVASVVAAVLGYLLLMRVLPTKTTA